MTKTDEPNIGVAPYSPGRVVKRPTPKSICEMLVKKSALRAELALHTMQIAEAIPALSPVELDELKRLVAVKVANMDTSTSQEIEREAALAPSTKAMDVKLSRSASRALQFELMRRLDRGIPAAPSSIVEEALAFMVGGA